MMKKITSLILAAMLLFGIVGCSAESDDAADAEKSSASATSGTAENTTDLPDNTDTDGTDVTSAETDTPDDTKVEAYTESFVNGECSVTLMYPRFGDGEHELFDISMRNYASQIYSQSGMMPEDSSLYEITSLDITFVSDTLVSAVATGHIINTTAAHDSYFAYTVNADPVSGRIYLAEELIGDLETVKTAIADGSFTQSYGIGELMNEITAEDITQSWRSDYGVFPDMYFSDDSFGVIAEIPHVLGGFAGFEIPLADADTMINDTAKGLLGE